MKLKDVIRPLVPPVHLGASNGRDNYLDQIRAFAALLVFFHHKGKLPGGSIGISIFFCLSGFLITRILIGLPELSAANVGKFIFRRWMRIFPLYAACLGATWLLMSYFKPELLGTFVAYLPGMLTFQTNSQFTGYAAAVGWTLHAEAGFYLVFPVLFALTYRRGLLPVAIAICFVFSIAAKVAGGPGDATHWAPFESDMWRGVIYLDQLMFGAVCALLIASKAKLVEAFRSRWWFWSALVVNIAIAKLVTHRGYDALWYTSTSAAAALTAITILHFAATRSDAKRGLVTWIGRVSFSVYLVHGIVIDYIPTGTMIPALDTPMALAITLFVSYFTYNYIELPGIRIAKRAAPFLRRQMQPRMVSAA